MICVKFGTKYDESYVRKLYQDIRDKTESEFNFYCYTDRWDGPSNGISLILPLGNRMDSNGYRRYLGSF